MNPKKTGTKNVDQKTSTWTKLCNLINIPLEIREMSLSLFLFVMGRGLWGDTFFSIYVKKIVGTGIGLTLIGTLLPLIKLFVVMPIWSLNDQGHGKNLLLSGKIFYTISALFYFLAGIEHSVLFLVFAVIFNGLWSSTMYTTYRSLYGKNSNPSNRSQIFWFYFSSSNLAYVIGALISSWLVGYLDLEYMFLFIVIFSVLSILEDGNIHEFMYKKTSNKLSPFFKRRMIKQNINYKIEKDFKKVKKFLGKNWFLSNLFKEIFSLKNRKKNLNTLNKYDSTMFVALWGQALINFVNYVGYLFIPLIAVQKNLSLSQIAILFAVMKTPSLINLLFGKLWDKYSKKLLISIGICIIALLFILMWSLEHFTTILLISFWISLVVAILQPISWALIQSYTKTEDRGLMTGVQELASRIWEIIWSFGFGLMSAILGMQISFQLLGLALGVLGGYCLGKKVLIRK